MMRITMIASSYPRFQGDGTAPFVRSIAESLANLGHNVTVVAPYDPEVSPYSTGAVVVNRFRYSLFKNWHIMGHAKSLVGDTQLHWATYFLLPFFLLAEFFSVMQVSRRNQAEIIYAHWVLPNGLVGAVAALLLRLPLIISLHGSDIFIATQHAVFGKIAAWIFRQATSVTACSPHLLEGAQALGCSPEKISLLPWGVDPVRFNPMVMPFPRESLGLESHNILLVALGRLVPKKGFAILLETLPQLVENFPELHLVIGGNGPLAGSLMARAEALGVKDHFHLVGAVNWEAVPDFLAMGDIFVLPSVYDQEGNVDGLPTVLFEAMGVGKPIIASRIAGIPLVVKDGVTGLLCEPGDVEELAQNICALLTEPQLQKALGMAGRQAVEKHYNWTVVAHQISELMLVGHILPPRLGSDYRMMSLSESGHLFKARKVLDVGCYDGSWLQTVTGGVRVGVDIMPGPAVNGICIVQADARNLPFRVGSFDLVVGMDMIEHVPDVTNLAAEMARVTNDEGMIFITTPSRNLRMFPYFLTDWISQKWGHFWRRGYTRAELELLFKPWCVVEVITWNAPAYRLMYIVLRVLYGFLPHQARGLLRWVARWDAQHCGGDHGFYWVQCRKNG